MKTIVSLCILLLTCFQLKAQNTLSTNQWQDDLRFLQQTIHKDYASLFIKTTKDAFDTEVEKLYNEIPNLTEHEIVVGMTKLVASFKYGHTGIFFHLNPMKFHKFPFNLYEFKDGIYIEGTSTANKKALGAKVLKINQIPVKEALQKIHPVVNAENSQYFKAYGINFLAIPEVLHAQKITKTLQTAITLTLEKEGTIFTHEFKALEKGKGIPKKYGFVQNKDNWLSARDKSVTPLYLKNPDKIYFFEHLADQNTVYVKHTSIANDSEETTENFYNRVFDFIENNNVDKLVIDVRFNGGGNSYLNKPLVRGIIKSKIDKVGSLYVITGRRSFSACQNLVNELDNYTNAIFVGEPTAENVNFMGDTRAVVLPNSKIPVHLSFAWWQEKPIWEEAEWLAPHVPVEMTYNEYINNEDPILKAALNFDGEGFIRNPVLYITHLFTEGNIEKLTTETPKIINDPKYSFINFETEFNKIGERLINGGAYTNKLAVQMFSFTTQLFPNSIVTLKNLGKSYFNTGDTNKASEILNKVLAMKPDKTTKKEIEELLYKQ